MKIWGNPPKIEKNVENRKENVAKHSHMWQLFYGLLVNKKTSFRVRKVA